jgi:hypothetical protein
MSRPEDATLLSIDLNSVGLLLTGIFTGNRFPATANTLYYQDKNGDIRETTYDDGAGWRSLSDNILATGACIDSGIAATTYDAQDGNGRQASLGISF